MFTRQVKKLGRGCRRGSRVLIFRHAAELPLEPWAEQKEEQAYERNYCFLRAPDCAVHDPAALQDAQAETTDRPIRITKDVPVLRIDHISIQGTLLGVWQVSLTATAVKCDPDSRETERRLSAQTAGP